MKIGRLKKIYILSFLFSLHIALSAYINSTFLSQIFSEKYVGVIYAIAAILTLGLLSKSSSILKSFGNRRLTLVFLVANMVSLLGLITLHNIYAISVSFILFLITNTLVFFCFDIFIEHFGNSTSVGKTRGAYLTIYNIAWAISPLIVGLMVDKKQDYTIIYLATFILAIITTTLFLYFVRSFKDTSYSKTPFIETYKFLKINKNIRAITIINFVLQFFYVWMVIYMPIYLHEHIGFDWDQIGVMFTIMLLAFVLLQLPMGILVDTYHVHKRTLLTIGLIIMGISTIATSFITVPSIIIWSIVLFMTRVGASITEAVSEIYFFYHVKKEESNLLSIFRDMTPVAYIVAPIIGSIFISIFPFRFLFIILGTFVLASTYYIAILKHTAYEHTLSN